MRYWFVGQSIITLILISCVGLVYGASKLVMILPLWVTVAMGVVLVASVVLIEPAYALGEHILERRK